MDDARKACTFVSSVTAIIMASRLADPNRIEVRQPGQSRQNVLQALRLRNLRQTVMNSGLELNKR